MSVGKLLRVPPSTSTMPLERTGSKRPGIDIVERTAVFREPDTQFFALPETTSVATQTKGTGSSAKLRLSCHPTVRLDSRLLTLNP